MDSSSLLTISFATALVAGLLVKFWLASRQIRHVAIHRTTVPPLFAQAVSLPAVVGCYDMSGLLWGPFAKELREGHHKIKGYFEHLFELEDVHVEFKNGEVRQYGGIYIQSGKYVFTFKRKKELISVPARYSFVCKKEKTGWFILEHHSSEFPA